MRFWKRAFPLGMRHPTSAVKTSPLQYFSWLNREAEQEAVEHFGGPLTGLGGFRPRGRPAARPPRGRRQACASVRLTGCSSMTPSAIASRTISLMRAMLLASSIVRSVCQPSTTGPSRSMIRWTSGSSADSRKPCRPRESRSHGSSPAGGEARDRSVRSLLHLFEHGAKQLRLVLEVVIKGAAGAHPGPGDQIADAGVEVALVDKQRPPRVDEIRRVASPRVRRSSSVPPRLAMATIVATFNMYVAGGPTKTSAIRCTSAPRRVVASVRVRHGS